MKHITEIGSEFWSVESGNRTVTIPKTYLSGRTALTAIILDLKDRGIKSVGLPDYCCESMIEPFIRQDMEIRFYPVWKEARGLTCSPPEAGPCGAVLVVNYFGFMQDKLALFIDQLHAAGKLVVLDQTHSVFCEDLCSRADYIFGSFRKWTGIEVGFAAKRDGGTLVSWPCTSLGQQYLSLRKQAKQIKSQFVAGGYQDNLLRRSQLDFFARAEELLDREYLSDTDAENTSLLASLNIDFLKRRRRENAKVIYDMCFQESLCTLVFPSFPSDAVPLAVPVLVSDGRRDSLRAFLRENGIFCPVHWPLSPLHCAGSGALALYKNEISLVCDQRYDTRDMRRMMEVIKQWEIAVSV